MKQSIEQFNTNMHLKDDRDDPDGPDKDSSDLIEETIEHQSDTAYDYQLDIECNEMPITIDELSMGVNNSTHMVIDEGDFNWSYAIHKTDY